VNPQSLTDRYIQEVVRRIPAEQREDVAAEMRATIDDTVEARGGEDRDAAEREVLMEMGDPIRLAAQYADRPQSLIGPELYPAYIRLVRQLLTIVLPLVAVVLMVLEVFDGGDVGDVIGAGIGAVFTVGAQLIAWPTVVFAAIDRMRHRDPATTEAVAWTPEKLPEVRRPDAGGANAWGAVVLNAVMIVLIVLQQVRPMARVNGAETNVAVIDPAAWSGWIWPVLVGLAGSLAFELVRVFQRRWTMASATGYAVSGALFAAPLAWALYEHRFFNPEFLAQFDSGWEIPDAFYTVTALAVLAISFTEVFRRFREAHAAR
jgi:hypothetical protein